MCQVNFMIYRQILKSVGKQVLAMGMIWKEQKEQNFFAGGRERFDSCEVVLKDLKKSLFPYSEERFIDRKSGKFEIEEQQVGRESKQIKSEGIVKLRRS